jgi:hypothetical protein
LIPIRLLLGAKTTIFHFLRKILVSSEVGNCLVR